MTREYGQYCPIAKGAEVFAERWTPLIVRNLALGCHSFSEIHGGVPRMSRSLLSRRLQSLERDGILERRPGRNGRGWRYHLTPAGEELNEVCLGLGTWAARWLEVTPHDYDPAVVLWGWHKFIVVERLPEQRVVVRFDLRDLPKERYWLLLQRPDVEICIKHPGLDEDLIVRTDSRTLTLVHTGRLALADAVRQGDWQMHGPPELARAFPTWGGLSRFAGVAPARPTLPGGTSPSG